MRPPLHLIGVGGIGMRGLAKLYAQLGWPVSGSDRFLSQELTQLLQQWGCEILSEEQIPERAKSVVYSSMITPDHPQRAWASEHVELLHRSSALAYLFHQFGTRIAVAGTHGKTTISSWLAHALRLGMGAGFCVGGLLQGFHSTAEWGRESFVIEADESDGSMAAYRPSHLLISNLEADHLDYWKSFEKLTAAMKSWAQQAPGVILCADDPILSSWKTLGALTYGFSPQADLRVLDYCSDPEGSWVELSWLGRSLGSFRTHLWGRHNAQNLAGAAAVCLSLQLKPACFKPWLESFRGTARRLELLGQQQQVSWYDDYAHHPSEVRASLQAVREALGKSSRLRVIFQPHRPSRLLHCIDQFALSFDQVDELWLLPVYLAGEPKCGAISSEQLAAHIQNRLPQLPIRCFESIEAARQRALDDTDCDLCLTMGAGSVTHLGRGICSV